MPYLFNLVIVKRIKERISLERKAHPNVVGVQCGKVLAYSVAVLGGFNPNVGGIYSFNFIFPVNLYLQIYLLLSLAYDGFFNLCRKASNNSNNVIFLDTALQKLTFQYISMNVSHKQSLMAVHLSIIVLFFDNMLRMGC